MRHLTDEQLIEHYFVEGANRVAVETHLRICSRCEQVYEEISNAMAVRAPEPPYRELGYGEEVWQSIQGELLPYPAKPKRSYFSWPRLVLASACLLGLAAAFLGGSLWERLRTHPSQAANPVQERKRVVLVILDDHLDRSERLLVQLNHAGAERGELDDSLQAEARQLLPDNRLYRQAISAGGDPSMTAALDHLERVLLEIANTPDKLSSADIARIEQAMNTDSLLFQIRVLRARTSQQAPKVESGRKGASI
jgi:predicted anti-sigma-YlaC factor YlaD